MSQEPPVGAASPAPPDVRPPRRRLAVSTAIFSVLTGLSRIAGLAREIVAAGYFGTTGPASAFTLAFQLPNFVRALVADAALSSAFVPVFSELLEDDRRREAYALAGSLFGLILVVLGTLTLGFILLAGTIIPPLTGDEFSAQLDALTVGLSQVLFPIVVLLGLNGLVVGILNAYDHFTIPALAPLVWNLVIITGLVVLTPLFEGDERIYAYAIGVLAGTGVQFGMCLLMLPRIGFPLRISLRLRGRPVGRVLKLMLPVTIGLGLINVNLLINSVLGVLVSDEAPRAIDAAFRIYMLPQGMFSVAVATVLFPTLSRLAARRDLAGLRRATGVGVRQIALLLIPAAAATIALAEPITRLVFERGEFDAESTRLVSEALFWFSFSLPFSGVNLLLTRTFFSLQRPWLPTALALGSVAVNVVVALLLYEPLGIAGIVIGTAASTAFMTVAQAAWLRRELAGLEIARTLRAAGLMLAAAAALGLTAYGAWAGLDAIFGDGLAGQLIAVFGALLLGSLVYAAIVLALRIPEARQILELLTGRLRGRRGSEEEPPS